MSEFFWNYGFAYAMILVILGVPALYVILAGRYYEREEARKALAQPTT